MTLEWVIESWPIRVALIGGAILLLGRVLLLGTRGPARRVWVGTMSVAAALLIVPLSLLPGWVPIDVPVSIVEPVRVAEITRPTLAPIEEEAIPEVGELGFAFVLLPEAAEPIVQPKVEPVAVPARVATESAETPTPEPFRWPSAISLATWAYALIAFGLLARLFIGHVGLARLWRSARCAPAGVEELFRTTAESVCPTAQLRVSTRAPGPVCFGVLRPRVLVPEALVLAGDRESLRCVFAHELGHLARRDPLAGWLLGLARSLYFVWPWVGGLRRQVRLAQEFLADADAVALARAPADYAELLVRLTRPVPAPLGAVGAHGSKSDLYRRVTMLLRNSGGVERRVSRRFATAIGGGLTAFAILTAGLYVRPDSATAQEKKADPVKPPTKPAAPPDAIKELIEKLKKDAGSDPEAQKQLEELLKALEKPKPIPVPEAPGVAAPPAFPLPPAFPGGGFPGGNPGGVEDMLRMQQDMLKQFEAMMQQMRGRMGGVGGLGAGGIGMPGGRPNVLVGGDGRWQQIGPVPSGRLGVRVEKPSEALVSHLDLPNGQGLVCLDVPANSAAGQAGIKPNDILLEVAGKSVPNDAFEFAKNLKEVKAAKPVDFVVLRKGKKETIKNVSLPEVKEPEFPAVGRAPNFELPRFNPPAAVRPVPTPVDGGFNPAVPGVKRNIGVTAGPGEKVRVEQVNDAFTVFYEKNGIKVTVTGSKEAEGAAKPESIEVEDGGKTVKAESVDKLPKEYQELAKLALAAIK